MVLGLRSKNRKGVSIQVDYLIHVKEIKPWPPSQSVRSAQSVLLQWENGDQSSGSFTSSVGDDKIEFTESFRLLVTLRREGSRKGTTRDSFHKNCLEFYLYESRNEKAVKGQLLGSAILNLADYGIVKETMTISTPINCKRSFRNTAQPVLYVSIQPFDKDSSSSSPKGSLSKEVSMDKDESESVSELMDDEDTEIASFTDDDGEDVSSHSLRTISSSSAFVTTGSSTQNKKDGLESAKNGTERVNGEPALPLGVKPANPDMSPMVEAFKSPMSSIILSSDMRNPANDLASLPKLPERILKSIPKKSVTPCVESSSSPLGYQGKHEEPDNCTKIFEQGIMAHEFHEKVSGGSASSQENTQRSIEDNIIDGLAAEVTPSDMYIRVAMNSKPVVHTDSITHQEDEGKSWRQNKNGEEATTSNLHVGHLENREKKKQPENGQEEQILEMKTEDKIARKFSNDAARKQVKLRSDTLTFSRKALGVQGNVVTNDNLKPGKSVQLHFDSAKSNGLFSNNQLTEKAKENDIPDDAHNGPMNYTRSETKETANGFSDSKVELESKIEMLEEELREAAAVEVGLYSVIAEHGSSGNKVHAPARRLSRFYFHACKEKSPAKRASAARTAVSGLVLVSKACGNDVPRLTFWLSNSIVLRAIVSQAVGKLQLSAGPCLSDSGGGGNGSDKSFSLKWHDSSLLEAEKNNAIECSDDWEDPQTFIFALEKVEAWIFSRIVESVWWQTLTPHMQPVAAKGSSSRKTYGRRYGLGDQEQGSFSLDLWKKAFKDACERLCPIRAGGHECGCLPVLARLVMEQLVSRLDVAMFNAILRESADEMPTDPVSDPISDPKVLPIPSGKSSFGAGVQLKNAIGNWSRWLTDLFGIDDNDPPDDKNDIDDEKRLECETSFKVFHLLNALSDLMMLPFEMLADRSTRKEVFPTLGAPLIKRVLNNFVPDEFCPNPIPEVVLQALDSEDLLQVEEDSITSFPCTASPTVYSPPPAASLTGFIGEVGSQTPVRNGSSVLRKSYTSDDELDELDSPLTSIIDNFRASPTKTTPNPMPKGKGGRKVVRYQLLRKVWRDGE